MTIREEINRQVSKVGLARALVYLPLSCAIGLLVLGTCGHLMDKGPLRLGTVIALLLAAIWACVSVIDRVGFSHRVRCPHCAGSLWPYLTKRLKRRRFRLPEDITECPLCNVDLAQTMGESSHGDAESQSEP